MNSIRVIVLILLSLFVYSCGSDPTFEDPYIMYETKITQVDLDECFDDENCMDTVEIEGK